MGCPCEIRIGLPTGGDPRPIIDACMIEIRRFEAKYSRYDANSIVSKINQAAGKAAVRIDDETCKILDYATVCFELSDGKFDITSGVLRRVWNSRTRTIPSDEDLEQVIAVIGWEKVRREEDTIFLPVSAMEIDLGGVVKEYVADAVVNLLHDRDISSGFVNLGGDIAIIGPGLDGSAWEIGISDPDSPDSAIAKISLNEGAITTSGGYERYIEIDGERFSHLLDPTTGRPIKSLLSVSVIAGQAIVAGSISTVALLKTQEEGKAWLTKCEAPYLAIDMNREISGTILSSSGFNPGY